jgi:hypothetical protein
MGLWATNRFWPAADQLRASLCCSLLASGEDGILLVNAFIVATFLHLQPAALILVATIANTSSQYLINPSIRIPPL